MLSAYVCLPVPTGCLTVHLKTVVAYAVHVHMYDLWCEAKDLQAIDTIGIDCLHLRLRVCVVVTHIAHLPARDVCAQPMMTYNTLDNSWQNPTMHIHKYIVTMYEFGMGQYYGCWRCL